MSLSQSPKNTNTKTVGGTAQTGGDWTAKINNLDLAYSNLFDGKKIVIGGVLRAISRLAFDVNNTTLTPAIAAVADQKIYVVGIEYSVDTDGTTFKLTENTVGDLYAAMTSMKGGGKVVGDRKTVLYETTTVNKALDITTAGGKATGNLWYCQF